MTATRETQWACSGKETDSELWEAEVSFHFWKQGDSPPPGASLLWGFAPEEVVMMRARASAQRKLWHLTGAAEKAGMQEGRRAGILTAERGIEALREMTLALDSFPGTQAVLAY